MILTYKSIDFINIIMFYCFSMLNDKFNFGFAVDLMIKDLKIALLEAKSLDLNLKVTKDVLHRYKKLSDEGYGSYDTSSLIKLLK